MDRTIELLQDLLARLGYLTGAVPPNEIDALTLDALHRFQQLHGRAPSAAPDDATWEDLFEADKRGECVVVGRVVDPAGPLPMVTVEVRDRELGDSANWPLLGSQQTDNDGGFVFVYQMASVSPGDRVLPEGRAVADLVFDLKEVPVRFDGFDLRRLPADDLVPDDEKAFGIPARRLEEVRLLVRTSERRVVPGASEWERLMAAFRAVWPQTSPGALDDGRREPEFVARELDEPREKVDALVAAFRLHDGVFRADVPVVILYGIARSDLRATNIALLALATRDQLKTAIHQAGLKGIIPPQPADEVENALRTILALAPRRALADVPGGGGASYADVLRTVLPDEDQHVALLQAAAGREGDPPAMWETLRAHPAFAEDGAIERAQFALQLDAVTGGHLPLMEALQTEHGITSIRGLLDVDAAKLRATIARAGVGVPAGMPGDSDDDRAGAYVTGLVAQLQIAFPTESANKVLGGVPAGALGDGDVHAGVAAALTRATGDDLRSAGAAFDIGATHIDTYLGEHGEVVLADVAPEVRPAVISAIKRTQRLFRVSTGPDSLDWLVRNDYHSAFQIAQVPRQTFIRDASATLGEAQARLIHGRAVAAGNMTLMSFVQMHDAASGIYPSAVYAGEDRIEAKKAAQDAIAKHMPSWQSLFGENAVCACVHCRSVYSPAAYLVDLLHFLDLSTKTAAGTPLDRLLARRPDLAQIKLTCENTNTEIPYVDLVSEILESLVVSLDPSKIPSFDTEGATAAELRAAPQHTNGDAYLTPAAPGAPPRVDRAVYPRSLPFDAPLAAARAYLDQLGVKRADLMTAFADGPLTNALAAERLGFSPNVFEVIAGESLDGTPGDLGASLDDRYGWPTTPPALKQGDASSFVWALKRKLVATGAVLAVGDHPAVEPFDAAVTAALQIFQSDQGLPITGVVGADDWVALSPLAPLILSHVPTFLERSELTFDELVQLLRTRFVNPEAHALNLVRDLRLPGAELLAFIQGGFQDVTPLAAALKDAGVEDPDTFTTWALAHFDGDPGARLRKTLLIDGPAAAACNLDVLTLRHWDSEDLAPTDAEWTKLDRFIRLWRSLGWSIDDLDLALVSLDATEVTGAVLRQLSQIAELARVLELSIPQVVALWADPEPTRPGSLYLQRFGSRALLRLDPAFQPDWAGRVLVGATIGEHVSALQAGLRATGADLAALRTHLGLTEDSAPLTLAELGSLLRSVTLARALRLNVRDLVVLLDLTGLQPFVVPTDDWTALRFAREVRRLQESGLNSAQLALVLGDITTPEPDVERDRLLEQLQEALKAIAAELDSQAETDGALTRRALALLPVAAPLADNVLAILLGTDRATAVLSAPASPAPVIPPEWSQRLVYEASATSPCLSCAGALTDAERTTITGFSTDARYRAAVTRLHAAPRAILADFAAALTKLGVTAPTAAQLLVNTLVVTDPAVREKLVRARLLVLLDAILPTLRERAARTLVKQTLAVVLPDAATLALLLEGKRAGGQPLLPASDGTRPLMADFLDLATSPDTVAAGQGYELLARARRLTESLGLDTDDVGALAHHLVAFRATLGRLCTYEDWTTIAAYARVRRRVGQPAGALATLWKADSVATARAALARTLGWADDTLAELMDPSGLGLGLADVQQLVPLERLIAVGELVVKLGVPVKHAATWARAPIGQAAADEARRAVKAKYDEPAWLEVAATLSDPLRDARRAALVAYLVPRLGLTDANALYQRLLIDVEMCACMATSRIKQAISSTQLFVQRCLLNIEPEVPPLDIDSESWTWMKNYRVWEANRKILLYPENWILPELRDDKTPFFKDLESALLQNDVSDANVERAMETYLEKLDAVAKLEIMAMHVQEDFDPDEKLRTVVHLFGRTANPPQARYYRRYVVTHNGTGIWTPWEVMPVDIQGDLVAPVTFNRRLYVFWATVATKAKDSSKKDQPPDLVQEIGLSWSEYCGDGWSPTRITAPAELLREDFDPDDSETTVQGEPPVPFIIERLEAQVEGAQLRLLCIAKRGFVSANGVHDPNLKMMIGFDLHFRYGIDGNLAYSSLLGAFVLDACHGKVITDGATKAGPVRTDGLVLRLKDGLLQAKPLSAKFPSAEATTVLRAVWESTRVANDTWVLNDGGYFVFEDRRRTFLAQVSDSRVSPYLGLVADQTFPRRISTESPEPSLSRAVTQKALVTNLARAETAVQPWHAASLSLANAGTASKVAAGGTIEKLDSALRLGLDSASENARIHQLVADGLSVGRSDIQVRFEPLFHPFVCPYIKALRQYGVRGVLTLGNQQLRLTPDFRTRYQPNRPVAPAPYPTSEVDFGATAKPGIYRSTAYSVYNWELFFHLPMLIADRLMQNRRFEDARRWLHYVFDPTDGTGAYWQVLPFQTTPKQSLEAWLQQLNAGDPDLKQQIAEWKDHPFEPHRIARMRLSSYKKYVVMKYLDNLIAWGDDLFKRDTMESINAATQLYVMAADLLGPRLQLVPPRGETAPMTFAQMRGKLDALSNVVAEAENAAPYLSSAAMAAATETVGLLGVSRSLYFCLLPNDKLLAYWDTVDDRLYKVRHCMNLAGVVRKLPLFEPPIDPALLVAARAQGVDLDSVLADRGAPLPHHRFRSVFPRAIEACGYLQSLAAALLSALEKKDAEALALLRASQDATLRRDLRASRKEQEHEALEQVEALKVARAAPIERLLHFRGLMGLEAAVPAVGANVPIVPYEPKPSAEGGVFLIDEEAQELSSSHSARDWQIRSATTETLASLSHFIPKLEWGIGPILTMAFGGEHVGPALSAIARYQATLGTEDTYDASHAGKMATYRRRHQDYAHQANLAAREIMHIDKQITVAGIHADVARLEREHLETEIAQAELVEQHYRSKYTNAELYGWMTGQISGLYFQSFQLALELAKSAERCFRFERGLTSSHFIGSGGWDDLHRGLLAPETLHLQLRQLERAHQEQDCRELEITKHVSIRQLAPLAFLRLKQTGHCQVELAELLYDMDYPGHFMRRIRSVGVSIPAVTGPYTSLNATLTLMTNVTRTLPELRSGKYERDFENEDDRFVVDFTPIQSIATSTGQNDHGLFEPGAADERYLPFEGAGAAGVWSLDLDQDCNRFDVETIADVVLHIRYTARDGGKLLAQKSKEHWKKIVADAESAPLFRLFSLKQEFPTEWHRLRTVADADSVHTRPIPLARDRFPLLFGRRELHIGRIELFGLPSPGKHPTKLPSLRQPDEQMVALTDGAPLGPMVHRTANVDVNVKEKDADSTWQLSVAAADLPASLDLLDDLLLVCHYDVRPAAG